MNNNGIQKLTDFLSSTQMKFSLKNTVDPTEFNW